MVRTVTWFAVALLVAIVGSPTTAGAVGASDADASPSRATPTAPASPSPEEPAATKLAAPLTTVEAPVPADETEVTSPAAGKDPKPPDGPSGPKAPKPGKGCGKCAAGAGSRTGSESHHAAWLLLALIFAGRRLPQRRRRPSVESR